MSPSTQQHLSTIFAIVITSAAVWYLFVYSRGPASIPVKIGDTTVRAELAITEEEKSVGLGGRESLDENGGMLYVFDRQDSQVFNMKDMAFPLDIIWINKDKMIVDVMKNAEPESYPDFAFVNDFLAQYVLEVHAGFFEEHNLELGDAVGFIIEDHSSSKLSSFQLP